MTAEALSLSTQTVHHTGSKRVCAERTLEELSTQSWSPRSESPGAPSTQRRWASDETLPAH